MPPKFLFVRHGEALHNVAYHERGPSAYEDPANKDAPLTAKGMDQARSAARAFAGTNPRVLDIWCSPLTRCMQTADEFFEETSASSFYLHDSLLERQGGNHICNMRKSKSELKDKGSFYNYDFLAESPFSFEEREPLTSLRSRMLSLVLLLAHLYRDYSDTSCLLVVSHADAIFALTNKSLKNAETVMMSLEEILSV